MGGGMRPRVTSATVYSQNINSISTYTGTRSSTHKHRATDDADGCMSKGQTIEAYFTMHSVCDLKKNLTRLALTSNLNRHASFSTTSCSQYCILNVRVT